MVHAAIRLADTSLAYVERGAGEPAVLVHGSASDHRTWRAQLDDIGQRFRVIAYSRRYHWPNPRIADGADYSMAEHAADLAAVVRSLGPAPAHVVGHSYGALVALALALQEPRLVRSLVLVEPPAITLFVSNKPKAAELLRLMLRRPRTAAALVHLGATGLGPATSAAARGDMEAVMRFVNGQRSPRIFHRLNDRLEELLPRATRVVIPGASHLVHEDNAPAFNEAVLAHLAAHCHG